MPLVYSKNLMRLNKTDLNVKNLHDVIVACVILHNMLPSQGKNGVQLLDIVNNHEVGKGELDEGDDEGEVFDHIDKDPQVWNDRIIWEKVCDAQLVFSSVHNMVFSFHKVKITIFVNWRLWKVSKLTLRIVWDAILWMWEHLYWTF